MKRSFFRNRGRGRQPSPFPRDSRGYGWAWLVSSSGKRFVGRVDYGRYPGGMIRQLYHVGVVNKNMKQELRR